MFLYVPGLLNRGPNICIDLLSGQGGLDKIEFSAVAHLRKKKVAYTAKVLRKPFYY